MIVSRLIVVIGYIDPGAGAMLLQWLLAAVIGSGVYFRKGIANIVSRLFRRGGTTKVPDKNASSNKQADANADD